MGCCKSKPKQPKYIPDNNDQNAPSLQATKQESTVTSTVPSKDGVSKTTRTVTTVRSSSPTSNAVKTTTVTRTIVTKSVNLGFRDTAKCSEAEIKPFMDSLRMRFPKGYLTRDDMKQVFIEKFPRGNPDEFINNIFTILDTNGDGRVEVHEFATIIALSSYASLEAKIHAAFKFMDKDGNGSISKDEVKTFFETLAKLRTGFNLRYRGGGGAGNVFNFDIADKDGDNQISKQEFTDYVKKHPGVLDVLRDLDLL